VNGDMSILIEHLIHQDWTECKANELDMNFKMEIVVVENYGYCWVCQEAENDGT
jgi:hypothetical protein